MKKTKKPYNKGDAYEARIFKLLNRLGLSPFGYSRAGAGGGTDCLFIHQGQSYNLEVKKDLKADYGQRYLKWSENEGWSWCKDDEVSKFYTGIGILDLVERKKIRPNRYLLKKADITLEDKKADQKAFEDRTVTIGPEAFLDYYAKKSVFYIQIGDGYGFYSLKDDPAKLNAPKFEGGFTLRLRCKTIHSRENYLYGFLAVLKPLGKPNKSSFNLERGKGQKFPPISP